MTRVIFIFGFLISLSLFAQTKLSDKSQQQPAPQTKKLDCEKNADALACKAHHIGKKIDQQTRKNDEKIDQATEGAD